MFAEASNEQMAVLSALAIIFGPAITWLYNAFVKARSETKADKKEADKGVIDHLRSLVDRQDQSIIGQTKEIGELRNEVRTLWTEIRRIELRETRTVTGLRAHNAYLEGLLKEAGIEFLKYDVAEIADTHTAEDKR